MVFVESYFLLTLTNCMIENSNFTPFETDTLFSCIAKCISLHGHCYACITDGTIYGLMGYCPSLCNNALQNGIGWKVYCKEGKTFYIII